MKSDDTYRLGAFLSAGIEPEKAEALVELIRSVEATENRDDTSKRLLTLVSRLIEDGVDAYPAFTAVLCHPSEHEPFEQIGSDYLASKVGG